MESIRTSANFRFDANNKQHYLAIVRGLKLDKQLNAVQLQLVRLEMAHLYHLTSQEWLEWKLDVAGSIEDALNVIRLQLEDGPTDSQVWIEYLNLQSNSDDFNTLLHQALDATRYDVLNNHLILQYSIDYYQRTSLEKLQNLFHTILSTPTTKLDDFYNAYSSFVSLTAPEKYEQEMIKMRKVYSETKKFMDFIEPIEISLLNQPLDPDLWIEYLQLKGNKFMKQAAVIVGIFERAVRDQDSESFMIVWKVAKDILYDLNAPFSAVRDILVRFVKRYPNAYEPMASLVLDLQSSEIQFYQDIKLKFLDNASLKNEEDTSQVLMAFLGFISKHQLLEFEKDLKVFYSMSLSHNDYLLTVPKMIIQIFDSAQDGKNCLFYVRDLTRREETSTNLHIWLLRHTLEIKYGDDKAVFKFLKECISFAQYLDSPDLVLDEVIRYSYLRYDAITISKLSKLIQKTTESLQLRLEEEEQLNISRLMEAANAPPSKNKRAHVEESLEPETKKSRTGDLKTRDREHLTLLVKNIPLNTTSAQLEKFFQGCEPINNIAIVDTQANIEFGNTQAMLALMTKNYKKFQGNELQIEQAFNTTIWVTNFPPSADKSWLEQLFSQCGTIVTVRLPSLKSNSSRRFCYIEFADSQSLLNAVKSFDDTVHDDYRLVVKLSNPDAKQKRSGAIEEGREVYICKIDFHKTTVERIRQIFERFGDIEKIHLPLSNRSKEMDRLHDGYGFVTFYNADDALRSTKELNGSNLDGRIIEVTIAQLKLKSRTVIKSEPHKKNTRDVINAKTIKLLRLPDTVSAHSLQSHLQEYGPVQKIDLDSSNGTAIVEFENVADAGIAELKLQGLRIDDQAIDVVPRDQSLEKPLNRRQRRLLEQAKKNQTASKQDTELKDTEMKDTEVSKTGLSNDDFRAMLFGKK